MADTARSHQVFVGTNSVGGSLGIYTLSLDSVSGELSILHTEQAYNTGYLAINPACDRLYAVSEGMTFEGGASGGVMAFAIARDGSLGYLGGRSTRGQRPCCLNLDGNMLYVCNFYGGSVAAFPLESDGAIGEMSAFVAETPTPGGHSGMHCVDVLHSGRYVGAVYLGRRSFIVYGAGTLELMYEYKLDPSLHPRHFAVSADGRFVYLLLQSPSVVMVLENRLLSGGGFELVQELSAIPEGFDGFPDASAVRLSPDGGLMFAAERSSGTITVCRRDGGDGRLEITDIVKLPGVTPRDFNITRDGKYLVTALQASGEVCVHRIDGASGSLELRHTLGGVPSPAAIVTRQEV